MEYWEKQDWRKDALCLDQDPELFFPLGNKNKDQKRILQAKMICYDCPVSEQCLTAGVGYNVYDGIWGGVNMDVREERNGAHKVVAELKRLSRLASQDVAELQSPSTYTGEDPLPKTG